MQAIQNIAETRREKMIGITEKHESLLDRIWHEKCDNRKQETRWK